MTRDTRRTKGLRAGFHFAASTILVFAVGILPTLSQAVSAQEPAPVQDSKPQDAERKKEIERSAREKAYQEQERIRWEQEQRNRESQERRDRVSERKRHQSDRAARDKRRNSEQRIEREERSRRRPSGPKPPRIDRGRGDAKIYSRRLPRPDKDYGQRRAPSDDHAVKPPENNWDGEPIRQSLSKKSPLLTRIINNIAVINNIKLVGRTETDADNYYWHNDGGIRWCHYYDSRGRHWFGFYSDDSYYWVRYDDGFWWLYDEADSRWSYWHDGYWRHDGPKGAMVYIGRTYYRYRDHNGGVVLEPEKSLNGGEMDYLDPDGYRMIQVIGAKKEAFLYDLIPNDWSYEPEYLTSLAGGVEDVRYAYTSDWVPKEQSLRIITIHENGIVRMYDSDGHFLRSKRFRSFGLSTDPVALILGENPGDFDPGFALKIQAPSVLHGSDAPDRRLEGGFFDGR